MLSINNKYKSSQEIGVEVPAGITMTFKNGNTISIQFGYGNYCDNYFESKSSSDTAEIAIWNKDKIWYKFPDSLDTVKGYLNSDEVAKWITFAANYNF